MSFSVLISVYHKENPDFLELALKSVVEQTLKPSEIVIVKDGPLTTDLEAVLLNYKINYPDLFTFISLPENKGLGNALSIGLLKCQFERVARMDTDDICSLDRFEKQVGFMNLYPEVDVVGTSIEEFRNVPGDLKVSRSLPNLQSEIISFSKLRNPLNHPTVMYKKSKVIEAGNYNSDFLFLEDYSLFIRMLNNGAEIRNLNDRLLHFRVGSSPLEMIKRRSGWNYAKTEWRFASNIRRIQYFSFGEWLKYVLVRIPVKLMPNRLILFLYTKFLRRD